LKKLKKSVLFSLPSPANELESLKTALDRCSIEALFHWAVKNGGRFVFVFYRRALQQCWCTHDEALLATVEQLEMEGKTLFFFANLLFSQQFLLSSHFFRLNGAHTTHKHLFVRFTLKT
jgi:hypothetical protein